MTKKRKIILAIETVTIFFLLGAIVVYGQVLVQHRTQVGNHALSVGEDAPAVPATESTDQEYEKTTSVLQALNAANPVLATTTDDSEIVQTLQGVSTVAPKSGNAKKDILEAL